MKNNQTENKKQWMGVRRGTALLLVILTLLSSVPFTVAFAASDVKIGRVADSLRDMPYSTTPLFIMMPQDVVASLPYDADTTVTIRKDTFVCMESNYCYKDEDNDNYRTLINYNGMTYSVACEDVASGVMTDSDVIAYVTGTYWKKTSFTTINYSSYDYIGIYAVQYALKTLGYYSSDLTRYYYSIESAVRNYQAAKGLTVDGEAGRGTLTALFAEALATLNSSSSDSTTTTPSGLTTIGDIVTSARKITASSTKTYLLTPSKTAIKGFSLDGGSSVTLENGTYYQLVAKSCYFHDSTGVFRVLVYGGYEGYDVISLSCEDAASLVVGDDALESYVTGTIWNSPSSTPIDSRDAHEIEVYAFQLALKTIGYNIAVDGVFGNKTRDAVYDFQTDNGLEKTGNTSKTVQTAVYAAARAAYTGSTSSSGSSGSSSTPSSAGSKSSSILPSSPKYYVTLSADTNIFTSETKSSGTTVSKGTVLQLIANQYYTVDGVKYMCLYHDNKQYQVLASDLPSVMSASALEKYVTGTLWTASSFSSINSDKKYLGSVKVHGLQYALQILGYYSGAMDGLFGEGTMSAVRNFQRANSLAVDGRAGPKTQEALYKEARAAYKAGNTGDITYGSSGSSSSSSGSTGSVSSTGTLTTLMSVNLRKGTSTSTTRMASVPANTVLTYTQTAVSGGVTWYYVSYSSRNGWLMGTYVTAGSTNNSTNSGSSGTLTIIKSSTRVRKTPNGSKTGQVLALNSSVSYYSTSSAGGYTWYYIQTASGIYGYVRGDCVTVTSSSGTSGSSGGGSGTTGTIPSTSKRYIKLTNDIDAFTTASRPQTGLKRISAGTVLQLASNTSYKNSGSDISYYKFYYKNNSYNIEYTEIEDDFLDENQLLAYITETFWKTSYSSSLKESSGLIGDVRVHGVQLALSILGYYSGSLDGNFGSSTTTAVKNFQRKNGLDVDGSVGPKTWVKLFPMARTAYNAGSWSSTGAVDSGVSSTVFGTVNTVEIGTWNAINNSAGFPKSSTAQVYDIDRGMVFTIYRWSGGNHADCFPRTAADTKIMCDIVNFPYNSSHPTSEQLTKIKADSTNDNKTHAWPDFKNQFGSGVDVGSNWDNRAALLNVNGRVFAVSIFGWPHGIGQMDSAKLDGKAPYLVNNYYGMMCVHFYGSTGHSDTTPQKQVRIDAINKAYKTAKSLFPNATFKSN